MTDTSFEDNYLKHYKSVVDLLRSPRFNMQQEDAEDLGQEVMLKVQRRWSELDQSRDPMPWFHMLTEGLFKNWIRDRDRRHEYEQASIPNEDEEYADSKHLNPENIVGDEEERGLSKLEVRNILIGMPMMHRDILTLVDIEGKGIGEAAEILGIGFWAAKKRVQRARVVLRRIICSRRSHDDAPVSDD